MCYAIQPKKPKWSEECSTQLKSYPNPDPNANPDPNTNPNPNPNPDPNPNS